MAHFIEHRNGCRVQIEKRNVRKSKSFKTKEDAQAWADFTEAQIEKSAAMMTMRDRVAAAESLLATGIPKRVLSALAEIPHGLEDVLDAAIPLGLSSGIYFLIKDKEVVYVGQSVNVLHRVARHRGEGKDSTASRTWSARRPTWTAWKRYTSKHSCRCSI